MPKPEILPRAPSAAPLWIFDTCQLGVVLRAVLAVQLLLCLAAAYTSQSVEQWLLQAAWLTSGGLFGSLAWLLLTCAAKRWLQHHAVAVQLGLGIALGAGCSLASSAILAFTSDLPPPHWWANMLTGGILAAGIMGWLLLRSHARMPAAATAQLALLQAKIRPHFLFNSLNSAIALVATEPHKAEQLLHDLSDLFRATLAEPRSTIPLREEVELAKRYLDIEQLRFGPRMQVRWNIDPEVLSLPVPPLVLQPLVENAVKHGVEPSETPAHQPAPPRQKLRHPHRHQHPGRPQRPRLGHGLGQCAPPPAVAVRHGFSNGATPQSARLSGATALALQPHPRRTHCPCTS